MVWMGSAGLCMGSSPDNRVFVERILQAKNIYFAKEGRPTAFVFQFHAGDSLRIECADCPTRIKNADKKGVIAMQLASSGRNVPLRADAIGKWLPAGSESGKLGLVLTRNGSGERLLGIGALTVTRKSKFMEKDVPGASMGILEVNNLFLDGYAKETENAKSSFVFKLRTDDLLRLDVNGIDRTGTAGVDCNLSRVGEGFAKEPLAIAIPTAIPGGNGNHDLYEIEISHNKDVKSGHHYHLSVARITATAAGTSSTKGK